MTRLRFALVALLLTSSGACTNPVDGLQAATVELTQCGWLERDLPPAPSAGCIRVTANTTRRISFDDLDPCEVEQRGIDCAVVAAEDFAALHLWDHGPTAHASEWRSEAAALDVDGQCPLRCD